MIRDIHPILNQVKCYSTGKTIPLNQCKKCEHYEFDGAVAALGEYTFTYDTMLNVQSPYICKLP